MSVARVLSRAGGEETIGDFLTSYAKKGAPDNLLEQATRIEKEKRALIMLEHNTAGRHNERHVLHDELQNYGRRDTIEAQKMYDEQVLEDEARSLYAAGNKAEQKQRSDALERVRGLERAGMEDGSISGLLNRRNEIMNDAIGSIEGYSRQDKIALNRLSTGTNYERPLTEIETAEMTELSKGINRIVLEDESFFQKMSGGYDEAGHMRSNNATSTNAMNGGTSGPTPPSSSNIPINPGTTPTGSTNYSGLYEPGETRSSSDLLGSMSQDGAAGVMSSVAFGAAIGGAANYAMGGEFGEGAMMGGIAGGGIKIGARAIQQNQASIENFLQRTALGTDGYTEGMTRETAAGAIQNMTAAPEGAGLMQKGAFNILKSESPSLGMQSRYMVMGGSALAGVTFTGNRKDKRRGFNAHRGNRI